VLAYVPNSVPYVASLWSSFSAWCSDPGSRPASEWRAVLKRMHHGEHGGLLVSHVLHVLAGLQHVGLPACARGDCRWLLAGLSFHFFRPQWVAAGAALPSSAVGTAAAQPQLCPAFLDDLTFVAHAFQNVMLTQVDGQPDPAPAVGTADAGGM
jgi:hypothetical protein